MGPSPIVRDAASQLPALKVGRVSERNQLLKRERDFCLVVPEFSPMASLSLCTCGGIEHHDVSLWFWPAHLKATEGQKRKGLGFSASASTS